MKPAPPAMDLQDWGLLIFLSILWGGSFMFIGIAVKELSPLMIVLCRVAIAAAVLLPFHWLLQGPLPRDRQSWVSFAGMSITNNVIPFMLFATGQSMITSGLASVINATTPLFGFAILALAGHETFSLRKIIGVFIGLVGVMVLKGVDLFAGGSESLGIFLCLLAAVSYGFGSLWARMRLMKIPPMTTAAGQLICSTVFMAVLVALFGKPSELAGLSGTGWIAILGLAVFATALAYIVFFRLITHAGPANANLVTMLIPVSAILMGYAVLSEALETSEIVGALIIVGALAIIDGRVLGLFGQRQNAAR
jgi:drug/metabolite transporter (DMT)-like permease